MTFLKVASKLDILLHVSYLACISLCLVHFYWVNGVSVCPYLTSLLVIYKILLSFLLGLWNVDCTAFVASLLLESHGRLTDESEYCFLLNLDATQKSFLTCCSRQLLPTNRVGMRTDNNFMSLWGFMVKNNIIIIFANMARNTNKNQAVLKSS